jgi:hypothetical protein
MNIVMDNLFFMCGETECRIVFVRSNELSSLRKEKYRENRGRTLSLLLVINIFNCVPFYAICKENFGIVVVFAIVEIRKILCG